MNLPNDDNAIIPITVGQMRNALWYYQNYLIQKELADSRGKLISSQDLMVDTMNADIVRLNAENESLRAHQDWFIAGLCILGGTIVIGGAIWIATSPHP